MDKYRVVISPYAYRDLDDIYRYIAGALSEPGTAGRLLHEIETAILGLETMPFRGAARRVGRYADKGYRQIFVKNYAIVYRVDEADRRVVIVTARYARSDF